VCNTTYFEVIEIVDGSKHYPCFLGLDWDFDNQKIIDLKKRQMIFELTDLRVIAPLDPIEGRRYVEPARGK
jgi:hypothetical protein